MGNVLASDDFDFTIPNRVLGEKLKEMNIKYIDLLEDIATVLGQKPLYKPNDSDFNIEGNEPVASMIAENLFLHQTQGIFKSRGSLVQARQ